MAENITIFHPLGRAQLAPNREKGGNLRIGSLRTPKAAPSGLQSTKAWSRKLV